MRFVSVLGDDANGEALKRNYEKYGIQMDTIVVHTGVSTGVATIVIDKSGENSIIVVPGANSCFSESVVSLLISLSL